MRARVIVNLDNPLIASFWVLRPRLPEVWVSIKYEKLQSFCYHCGKLGHDLKACRGEKFMSLINPNELRFGAAMTTAPVRALGRVVLTCDGFDGAEKE